MPSALEAPQKEQRQMTIRDSLDSRVLRWSGFAITAFLAGTMMMGMAHGEDRGEDRGEGRGRHQPPPAAFDACQGKKATDTCQVVFGERKIDGICQAHDDGQLFCRPQHHMGPRRPAP
jgi:hypothetical protein